MDDIDRVDLEVVCKFNEPAVQVVLLALSANLIAALTAVGMKPEAAMEVMNSALRTTLRQTNELTERISAEIFKEIK